MPTAPTKQRTRSFTCGALRRCVVLGSASSLLIAAGLVNTVSAEELAQAQTSGAFARQSYDREIAAMRFGFSKPKPIRDQAVSRARAKIVNAYLPDAGSSFRAHYAFSAEAAAEQLQEAEQRSTDELSQLRRRAKLAITERPIHQRLVRKNSWMNSLGLDRRTVDKRELVAKVDELQRGAAQDTDKVEALLGDIEADGFLYTVARASHQLVISAEKSLSKIYSDYVAPADAHADETDREAVTGSRPLLSYERDGLSRF